LILDPGRAHAPADSLFVPREKTRKKKRNNVRKHLFPRHQKPSEKRRLMSITPVKTAQKRQKSKKNEKKSKKNRKIVKKGLKKGRTRVN